MLARTLAVLILFLLVLVGCQPQEGVLPTLVDLNAFASQTAVYVATNMTPTREPLPPTWTPSPEPTIPPSATAPIQQAGIIPTPVSLGRLYYIFNGDSIVKLIADGSFEELLPIPHIGMSISDLVLSPDDTQLAYVAPGNGSAREIYITDLEGVNARQITNLGFARVIQPIWRPDGGAIAFLASQTSEAPLEIYVVSVDGSGQRPLTQRGSLTLSEIEWSSSGDRLFFSDQSIYALDLASGAVTIPLTAFTGFGSDFSLSHHPSQPKLYYVKPFREFGSDSPSDYISFIDTTSLDAAPTERRSQQPFVAVSLRYSRDGSLLLIASADAVWVQDEVFGTAAQVHQNGQIPPVPTLSPDGQRVAFVDADADGVPQIFTVSRQGEQVAQITRHLEGSIVDLVWAQD